MSLKRVAEIGEVFIKIQSRDSRYYLSYPDSSGRRITKSTGIKAETARQLEGGPPPAAVIKMARDVKEIKGSKYSTVLDSLKSPLIGDAINKAIAHSRGKEERRADLKRFRDYFLDWLLECRPRLKHWEQVTGVVVMDYLEYQHSRGVGPKSLKHYIGVLTMTASYWNRLEPARYHPLRINSGYLVSEEPPEKHYLNSDQTMRLWGCANVRRNRAIPRLVVLGCFAGCNIKEIIRLQARDFDPATGLLHITRSKNKYRRRTIPLLPMVREWLAAELQGMAPDAMIVTNAQGFEATHHSAGLSLRRLLNSVSKDFKDPAFSDMDPKDIRKTFINLCLEADVALSDIGAYAGHGPTSMTDRHYADTVRPDRLQRVVILPLASYLERGKKGKQGNVLEVYPKAAAE